MYGEKCIICMVKSAQYVWIKVYNVYGEKCTMCTTTCAPYERPRDLTNVSVYSC